MIPKVQELAALHDDGEAYISRDTAGELSGLEPSKILRIHQPTQEREVGILRVTRRGRYAMVPLQSGGWRGEATRWVLDMDAYTPVDIPAVKLETEQCWVDIDAEAVAKNFLPTTDRWAKEPEAYRLVLALIHHTGFARVRVTPQLAAQVLGKHRVTGYRTLKTLERLGLYEDGWVDYQFLLVSPDASDTHDEIKDRTARDRIHRWSVFTREGWMVRVVARQAIENLPLLRQGPPLTPKFSANVRSGESKSDRGISRAVRYFKAIFEEPGATGRPVEI